ncbi:MAG: 7TM diverse intracellular signaling domain-containing protein [Fulvivirga sp.]|uniref:7TM diverse intracellular signaling domain-containing protein n=1 Tax=Fulvivirga sp. TaxID=1931237 RepID=UPI0032ED7E7E
MLILGVLQLKALPKVLNPNDERINLNSSLQYFRSADKNLTFEQALRRADAGLFTSNDSNNPINFGYDSSDFWFYTEFQVKESGQYALNLPYPYHQYLDLYIDSGEGWNSYKTGNLRPFHTRGELEPENFAWTFYFNDSTNNRLLIHVKSRSPIILSAELSTPEEYVTNTNKTNVMYGIFFGILMVMVIYNFFLYLIIRDKTYIYYIILVLANIAVFASVSGYAFHYIYPDSPEVNYYIRELFITILIIPTSLFAISFLDLKKYSMVMYYVLTFMIVFAIIISVLICFGVVFGFSSFIISIHAPLLLAIGILVRIRGNINANFYIIAWSGYLIGGTAMTLRNSGVLPAIFFTDHGAEIGAILDVFLLALALAYKYKQIRNERSQLQKENIQLIEKQNVLLEQKVKERTQLLDSTLQVLKKQHDDLSNESTEINSSINYALTIQEKMFPKKADMTQEFRDVVLFKRAKQTVSGDFVFFENLDDYIIIALADCTGHGVPGALLSMAAYNLFYDAVHIEKLTKPASILAFLEMQINVRLNQSDNALKEGMETAVCVLDKRRRILKFAGAQRPILIVNNGTSKLIKGSKKAIGGHFQRSGEEFKDHYIDVTRDLVFYLYSDGFQDQFGGIEDKKYMSKRLVNLLTENAARTSDDQEKIIGSELDDWKGDREQIDDILILGVKV